MGLRGNYYRPQAAAVKAGWGNDLWIWKCVIRSHFIIYFKGLFLLLLFMCMHICECLNLMYVGTHRGQNRSLDLLKLELEAIVAAGNFGEPKSEVLRPAYMSLQTHCMILNCRHVG